MSRKAPAAPHPLTTILQTADPTEQEQRVQALLHAVKNPPFSLMITFNPLNGQAQVQPAANITFDLAQAALSAAQAVLREQEKQALLAQPQTAALDSPPA